MIVLVSWCCNVSCHSVGRVPSSDPRSVRLPTAVLCFFYPIPFLFVVSVWLVLVRFVPSLFCSLFLSPMSSPLLFLCATYSLLRLPLPFLFMYCVNVICFVFFLNFRFAFSSSVSCPALRSAFRFPMLRCASYPLFWLCSAGSLLSPFCRLCWPCFLPYSVYSWCP